MMDSRPAAIRIPRSNNRAGQGLLEFALIVPIFLVLTIGALDLGMAFYVKVVLANSAREGAYFLVYHTETGKADSFEATKTAVQAEGGNSGVDIATAKIDVQCLVGGVVNNACPNGSTAVVTVAHDMELLVDVIFHGPLQLTNEARMLIP
jgi:Flp pilus assembly protein TadG